MLTKEADDFLGQIILNINHLHLNGEQSYKLNPRTDGHIVTGHITLSFTMLTFEVNQMTGAGLDSKKDKANYMDQYRCLHNNIFKFLSDKAKAAREPPNSVTSSNSNSR